MNTGFLSIWSYFFFPGPILVPVTLSGKKWFYDAIQFMILAIITIIIYVCNYKGLIVVRHLRIGYHWLVIQESRFDGLAAEILPTTNELRHEKINIMGLRPAWIQTSLRICAVWSGSMPFAYKPIISKETDSEQHGSWSDCADAKAGLDPCWSQTHYVGFVMARLKCVNIDVKINNRTYK
jgi:hypothetical protein